MKPHIVVMGMGEIGSVLAPVFKKRGYAVSAWDKVPGKVPQQKSLFEIIPTADILFLCIPSWHLPEVTKSIGPFLKKNTIVVALAKGLQKDTQETPFSFLSRSFPHNEIVMFGGAMLAEEIALGMPGVGIIAAKKESVRSAVSTIFKGSSIRVSELNDPEGGSMASVLKNVYALGLGIAQGISWGGNGRAWLARIALSEMEKILQILGKKKDLAWSESGFVDLIATGFSEFSKNVEVGNIIAKTKKALPSSEGLVSLEPLSKLLGSNAKSLPLFSVIYKSAMRKEKASILFQNLLRNTD